MPSHTENHKSPSLKKEKSWARIKSEAFKLYIQQDMQLEETMSTIERSQGFKASPRMWKLKLKQWGYKKNKSAHDMSWIVARGEKRKLEGKETSYFVNGTEIRKERIENFKRRRMGEGLFGAGITYGTPSCGHNEEEAELHDKSLHRTSSSIPGPDVAHDELNSPPYFEIQGMNPLVSPRDDVPARSRLDRYLKEAPWSPYNLFFSARHDEKQDGHDLGPTSETVDPVLHELLCLEYEIKYGAANGTAYTSTASDSTSLSHKNGMLTYPESEITGISNSEFYGP